MVEIYLNLTRMTVDRRIRTNIIIKDEDNKRLGEIRREIADCLNIFSIDDFILLKPLCLTVLDDDRARLSQIIDMMATQRSDGTKELCFTVALNRSAEEWRSKVMYNSMSLGLIRIRAFGSGRKIATLTDMVTLDDLKEAIYEKTAIHPRFQLLYHKKIGFIDSADYDEDKMLMETVFNYKVYDNIARTTYNDIFVIPTCNYTDMKQSSLHWGIACLEQVTLQYLTKTESFNVDESKAFIRDVKSHVVQKYRCLRDELVCLVDGKEVFDKQSLVQLYVECKREDNEVRNLQIDLIVVKKYFPILVTCLNCEIADQTLSLKVASSDSIGNLKKLIENETDISSNSIQILFNSQIIQDDTDILHHHNISPNFDKPVITFNKIHRINLKLIRGYKKGKIFREEMIEYEPSFFSDAETVETILYGIRKMKTVKNKSFGVVELILDDTVLDKDFFVRKLDVLKLECRIFIK